MLSEAKEIKRIIQDIKQRNNISEEEINKLIANINSDIQRLGLGKEEAVKIVESIYR